MTQTRVCCGSGGLGGGGGTDALGGVQRCGSALDLSGLAVSREQLGFDRPCGHPQGRSSARSS